MYGVCVFSAGRGHKHVHECGTFLDCSSALFIDSGSLNQNQSFTDTARLAKPSASETGVTDKLPCTSGVYMGSAALKSGLFACTPGL